MTNMSDQGVRFSRRKLLRSSAALALVAALVPVAGLDQASAAGGKVVIGAFADGGLTPFKEKIIPLAKQEGGFDVEFLEDEYGVTLEKWFADAQSGAGQYDIYLLDDPWVLQRCEQYTGHDEKFRNAMALFRQRPRCTRLTRRSHTGLQSQEIGSKKCVKRNLSESECREGAASLMKEHPAPRSRTSPARHSLCTRSSQPSPPRVGAQAFSMHGVAHGLSQAVGLPPSLCSDQRRVLPCPASSSAV